MHPLDATFSAVLLQSPSGDDWTYVVMPDSPAFSATRGLVRVRGTIDGRPFTSAFVALGEGGHKVPVRAAVLEAIGKHAGDTVAVRLTKRLD
jgi:hypothetical protein